MKYTSAQAKDYARANFRGVWAAITTPFDANEDVDEAALRRDIRHYIDVCKVDGFFFNGLVGEVWALTVDERERLQEVILDEVGDGCQTIAHTSCMSLRDTIRLTRHAEAHGADYIIVLNPPVNSQHPDHLVEWFRRVCGETDLGVAMFNNSIAGYALSPEMVARIGEIENVIAIKDAQPLEHITATRRLAGDSVIVCDPDEGRFCENVLEHGDTLFMSSPSPFLLQREGHLPINDYAALAFAGKAAEARALSATLEPGRAMLEKWIVGPWRRAEKLPMAEIKYWSELLGMAGGAARRPLLPLGDEAMAEMRRDLEAAGVLVHAAAAE